MPERLYLDSDMLLNYLIRTEPHHVRSRSFVRRLAAEGRTAIVVSSLTWLEIAHVVTREDFRRRLPLDLQQRFDLARWQAESVRESYVRSLLGSFERVLALFEWTEVFITDDVRAAMVPLMIKHRLSGQDACHLACATREGVADFASYDAAYRRVDGLSLWNDAIHGAPRLPTTP